MCFYLIVDQKKLLFPRIACIALLVLLVVSCEDNTKTTESVGKSRFIAYNNGVDKDTKTGLE